MTETTDKLAHHPLPTMYDLPSESLEEPGLPNEFHDLQPQLLSETLKLTQYSRGEIFTASDLNLYYDSNHTLWYKRPDWFLVVGVPRLYRGQSSRQSYVIWDEQVPPIVVVEFLSPGTEAEDLGRFAPQPPISEIGKPPCKFDVYEQVLKIPNYIVYDEPTQQIRFFRLVKGRYEEQLVVTQNPRLWIPELNLGLGLWQGEFRDLPQPWLRWCDTGGQWIQTDAEAAQRQIQQGAANLLQMGLSVEQVAQALGLSEIEVRIINDRLP